jgi:hypothetical protein
MNILRLYYFVSFVEQTLPKGVIFAGKSRLSWERRRLAGESLQAVGTPLMSGREQHPSPSIGSAKVCSL